MPTSVDIPHDIFALAFGAAPSGMLVVASDGHIVVVNAQLAGQFGYAVAEMAGMRVEELLPPRYRGHHPTMRAAFHGAPSTRGMGVGRDLYAIRRDGTEFPVEVGLNPVQLDGEAMVICTIVDITERKRAESERAALNRQLVETSRRVGMADVATSVLHNVGNVLTSVNTSATAIRRALDGEVTQDLRLAVAALGSADGGPMPDTSRLAAAIRFLDEILHELTRRDTVVQGEIERLIQHVDHVKQVVSGQLRFAKQGGLIEPTPLDEVIHQAISMTQASFDRDGLSVECRLAMLAPVRVDRHQVLQILTNLLTNARDAIDAAGPGTPRTVGVTLEPSPTEPGTARITVQDHGIGIAPEVLPKLFDFGFTTREHGHGFGLHSSAIAARAMGGRLSVRSDGVGRGATFTLELTGQPIREAA